MCKKVLYINFSILFLSNSLFCQSLQRRESNRSSSLQDDHIYPSAPVLADEQADFVLPNQADVDGSSRTVLRSTHLFDKKLFNVLRCKLPDEQKLLEAKQIVGYGVFRNYVDENGSTALTLACLNRLPLVATYFLENGWSPNVVDKVGRNLLEIALENCNFDLAHRLILAGTPIKDLNALFFAISNCQTDLALTLIERDPKIRSYDQRIIIREFIHRILDPLNCFEVVSSKKFSADDKKRIIVALINHALVPKEVADDGFLSDIIMAGWHDVALDLLKRGIKINNVNNHGWCGCN